MERSLVRATLFGLLLAFVTTQNKDDWDIYSFHINSTVTSRYATTVITSRVVNRMDQSKEIEFHVRIPKNAFISKFRMFMDGQVYDGVVKAKEQAQRQYTEAVSRGQSAGIVSSVGRTLEEFKTSVTVAAHKKVTFELTYEELLKRRLGKYELQIHARPMQPVRDFKIDVYINEKAGINYIDIKGGLSTKALASAITKTVADKQAWVYFYPTEDQQKICDSCTEQGMNGDLVIVYDVNRDNLLGDIKESDGYFVHHFAPVSLPRIPKNVVFIIDRSGSMHGRKMHQTRIALIHILGDLAEDDHFGLITFDGNISPWRRELLQANKKNLDAAKTFAQSIQDGGSTDINRAVLEGARMLNKHPREGSASILILLTDGDPTTGETNLEIIQSNVRKAIKNRFPLYCLGFGFDVNFEFLEKMALENNGMARRIYEDSDADLQLKGFYKEVAVPLLIDVTMVYVGGTNLTQTNFSQYYNGSEIVVAGQITDNNIETFTPQVVAISRNRRLTFSDKNATVESSGTISDSNIKRIWAYLTVKQLLEKELQLAGDEKEKVKKEALELSLKYNFVTPLTSMVVTKPPGENTEVLYKPKENGKQRQHGQHGQHRQYAMPGLSGINRLSGQPGLPGPPLPKTSQRFRGHWHSFLPRPTQVTRLRGGSGYNFPLLRHADATSYDYELLADPLSGGGPLLSRPAATDVAVDDYELSYNLPATQSSTTVPNLHRFLLKADNQTLPLCFDVTGSLSLKLLHDPNREMSVNGELDSLAYGGFRKIVIRSKTDQQIEIATTGITVRDRQNVTTYRLEDIITVGRVTMIVRDKEMDISDGETRMVILFHEKHGEKFMWPVLRQRPSGDNINGLLAVNEVYEEIQQGPSPKLKIKDQEVYVTRSSAVDYSIASAPTMDCWLASADSALQRQLQDFTVTQA